MIPMRTSTIFKSRWMALVWAAGILYFAYDFVGSEPQDQSGNNVSANASSDTVSDADANKIAQILGD